MSTLEISWVHWVEVSTLAFRCHHPYRTPLQATTWVLIRVVLMQTILRERSGRGEKGKGVHSHTTGSVHRPSHLIPTTFWIRYLCPRFGQGGVGGEWTCVWWCSPVWSQHCLTGSCTQSWGCLRPRPQLACSLPLAALGFLWVLGICFYMLPVLSRGRSLNLYIDSHPSQQYHSPPPPPPHIPLVTSLIPDRDFVRTHGKATYLGLVLFPPKTSLLAHSPRAEHGFLLIHYILFHDFPSFLIMLVMRWGGEGPNRGPVGNQVEKIVRSPGQACGLRLFLRLFRKQWK